MSGRAAVVAAIAALSAAAPAPAAEPVVRPIPLERPLIARSGEPHARGTATVRRVVELRLTVRGRACHGPARAALTLAGRTVRFTAPSRARTLRFAVRPTRAGRRRLALRLINPRSHGECVRSAKVGALAVRERVPIGAAVRGDLLAAPGYATTLARHFGVAVAENEMKQAALQPTPGHYDFTAADALVNAMRAQGKQVHGHALIYGEHLPRRFVRPRTRWTRESLTAWMRDYVHTVVRHFAGRVASWDVVNEAFEVDGSMAENIFHRVIGPDYVALAFRFAREADPDVILLYNDQGIETVNRRSEAVVRMFSALRGDGVPIDGIGSQTHVSAHPGIAPTATAMLPALERFAAAGAQIYISELDATTREVAGSVADRHAAQAAVYAEVAAACQLIVACRRLTVWGVADQHSWKGADQLALPFDSAYSPKPAWTALTSVLR